MFFAKHSEYLAMFGERRQHKKLDRLDDPWNIRRVGAIFLRNNHVEVWVTAPAGSSRSLQMTTATVSLTSENSV